MLEALPPGPPRLVGPYRLLARLGAGGMGEVHLACRADAPTADPRRMVAVKTVREDLDADADFRARFRREITAARAVDSPYAARLVDADAEAAVPWLATEYVPGPSLAEAVVRSGALPVAAARALGVTLARALDAVHGAQVLHRDLKPANVLLGADGPKLIDFGIAQAFEATALTSTGLVVGSPGFMSPEHLTGSRAVVPASDVFCLGAVLAFAASGRGPFHDDEMAAVIYRISRAEAELDGVPAELRPVVERCLRLDPAGRPSAAELAELLEAREGAGAAEAAGASGPRGASEASGPSEASEAAGPRGASEASEAAGPREASKASEASGPSEPSEAPEPSEASVGGSVEGASAEAAGVFPWPSGVLSLLASYREAARVVGEEAASGAGVAELPTLAPVVPYSPTAVGYRPAEPGPAPRRRPWAAVSAAVVAVAVVAAAGVVFLGRGGGQDGAGGPGASGPSGSSSPSTSASGPAAPSALSRVVLPYGGEGHTGDFGTAATDRASRPAGWSPWTTKTDPGTDACSLAPKVLLCVGSGGAAVALRAADGTRLWSVPGREVPGEPGQLSSAGHPAVVGDTAYVTGPTGITAYGIEDGRRKGEIAAPGSDWAIKGSDLLDGVLYSAYLDRRGRGTGLVAAVRLDGKGSGRQLWRTPLDAIPEKPVAGGGRVYVPIHVATPVALDATTGKESARAAAGIECGVIVLHGDSVVCPGDQDRGMPVLDARTLKRQRTLGAGRRITGTPAVRADGTVAVTADLDTTPGRLDKELVAYDLASGRERWVATPMAFRAPPAQALFAGDRAVTTGQNEVTSIPATGPPARMEDVAVSAATVPKGFSASTLIPGTPLVSGGAVFVPFSDGLVISVYLPSGP
ncbi:protein kinase [Streptomyces sp. NPDC048659]|uniref:serine/threonine-protein kinase n=1 Tax=Streptomyces sp. NPDC048659 TaxID=3155489 RepID=UPI00342E1F7F